MADQKHADDVKHVGDVLQSEISDELHEATGVAEHGEHVEAAGPFADPTFWATIAVLIFLGILVWKKIPATIAKSLDDRAQKIQDELDNARLLREKAQAALAEAERSQAQAEEDAKAIVAAAKAEAKAFADTSRADLKERMERREKMAEERIARAEAEATQAVRNTAAEAASAAAAGILRESTAKGPAKKSLFETSLEDIKKSLG
ncbi:F0F1 ATP synthase subunit B family protein [Hirschia baltica]|uniref:ATP synthase subunit b n=1 Tax=Hirschia baltica (strain ATCC 49814 / DSM 5838 / IFAM 1418) TaxID=582402 RepID=C6XRB7_HIRBI|nr:H+transporting two-sector ATPase subunit B/B' [Hirschia baltica]ACT58749.1 H+transporting two-sector ATPase B/B' subunit [Hirschia baltica ATCC 49814]